jgi:hypothetical protein
LEECGSLGDDVPSDEGLAVLEYERLLYIHLITDGVIMADISTKGPK